MSLFISDAWAQAAPAAGPEAMLTSFLPLIVIFALFYFLLIRPQMKRAKEHKMLVAALSKDDEVVTSGGLLGRVTQVGEDFIVLEVAPNVQVKVQRHAVSGVMPKGTIKSV